MLQLYDKNKTDKYPLEGYSDYYVESVLKTGDKTLSFSIPLNNLYSNNIELEGYLRTKTSEFVIKEIQDQGTYKGIKATLNVEDLEGKTWDRFDSTEQTISYCLNLALVGTGWTVGTCAITKKRTVRKTGCSSWDIIQQARKTYSTEMEFDTINKKINIAETLGTYKGCYFTEDLNLKALDIQGNSYDYYTRINAVGKDDLTVTVENYQYSNKVKTLYWKDERYTDINSLTEDATLKLNELSKPYVAYSATVIDLASASDKYKGILDYSLGDIVTLISKDKKVKERQRIVKIVEYPDEPSRNTCEIANTTLKFEDVQKEQQDTTDTVNNITSDNGTISEGAIKVAVQKLTIGKADIQSLNAVTIRTGDLETTRATITQLNATNIAVGNLQANKAEIGSLSAATGRIGTLETNVASINTLVNGNLTSNNIQSLVLTSAKVTVDNGFIKNAMIENLDVSKINAGSISTNKFRIVSDSGKMVIADNTILINDTNRTRVQIGKDASNDYNMYVWDSAGKLMFDATGLKADGVKAKIIRDDMISDTANINGGKINISSLVTELNKDTNTSVIKASKVNIDLTGQTLEVAFNSLKSNVDNTEIGGRNLLLGSDFEKPILGGFIPYGSATISLSPDYYYRGSQSMKLISSAVACGVIQTLSTDILNLCKGRNITLSFKVRGVGASLGKQVGAIISWTGGSAYGTKVVLTDVWQTIYATATIPSNGTYLQIYCSGTQTVGDILYIDCAKLELGNKVTDWTPAPEDIDSKIETNTTSISVQQGQINTLISNSEIIQGDITTINDNYSSLSQSVNGLSSTVGSHSTSISTLNTNVGTAQTMANNANTLADSKAKVFTATPTTPYKVGDLWVQGPSGNTMKCKVARASGSYTATDWDKASKYTDDTKANSVASDLSAVTTRVTSAESAITQNTNSIALKVNTSDFTTYKNSNDSNISTINSTLSVHSSSISVLQGQITTKVEQTDIEKTLNAQSTKLTFKNLINGTFFNEDSFMTTSGTYEWDAGFSSINQLEDGQYVEHTVLDTRAVVILGLSSSDVDATESTIQYGLYSAGVYLRIIESGVDKGIVGDYLGVGDRLRIGIMNGSIHYYQNGNLIYVSTTPPTLPLVLDTSVMEGNICQIKMGTTLAGLTSRINTAKSEIKQTTDSISANVTSLQSTTNTLTTQMGNKAETSTVTAISNRTSSLEANVSSITSRVSSVEGTTSTLNGTVVSQGTRLSTAETKLTDSAFTVQIQKNSSKIYKIRYIRDWVQASSSINDGYNLWVEVQAINNVGVNLASGKTPTSNYSIRNPLNATNGGLAQEEYTIGTSSTLQYLQIDLGAVYQNVDMLKIWHYYGDNRTFHKTKTEVSEDGINWLPVFDSAVSGEYAETAYGHTIQLNTNSINTSSTTINEGGVTINNGALMVKNSNSEVIIDGKYNMHKIVVTGTFNITFPADQTDISYEIPHNLGYKPCVSAYADNLDQNWVGVFPFMNITNVDVGEPGGSAFGIGFIGRMGLSPWTFSIMLSKCGSYLNVAQHYTIRYYIYKEVAI